MYKINIEQYDVESRGKKIPYDTRKSLIEILLAPAQQHNASTLRDMNKICDKIDKEDKEVLLEDSEYQTVKTALDKIKGFTKNDLELVNKVFDAEQVEVETKKNEKEK